MWRAGGVCATPALSLVAALRAAGPLWPIAYAVAGRLVELVERDLLALGSRRIERHGTGDERQTQEAFPVGANAVLRKRGQSDSRRTADHGSDPPPSFTISPIFSTGRTRLFCSCYVLIGHDRPTRELAHADVKANGKDGRCRRYERASQARIGPGPGSAAGILAGAAG